MLNKLAIATLALFLSVGVVSAAGPNGINTTVPMSDPGGTYPAGQTGVGAAKTRWES